MGDKSDETIDEMLSNHQAQSFDEMTTKTKPRTKFEMIERVVDEVYDEVNVAHALVPRSRLSIDITGRFKRLHGQAQYNRESANGAHADGHHVIRIAENIIGDDDHDWKNTVRHELAHVFAYEDEGSSQRHNHVWKEWARRCGAEPKRCASTKHTDAPYRIACPSCETVWDRHKRSKTVKYPGRYSCNRCDTNIVSYETGDPMPTDPGTCEVDW